MTTTPTPRVPGPTPSPTSSPTSSPGSSGARTWGQAVRFALVGGGGVVVNLVVAIVLNRLNGGAANAQQVLFPLPGTPFNVRFTALVWVVAFLVAVLFNYQLNRTWTFGEGARGHWFSGFWRFLVVGSVAAVVGLALKIALTHPDSPIFLSLGWFDDSVGLRSREYWAHLIAVAVTMPVNFLVNRVWTFGESPRLRSR